MNRKKNPTRVETVGITASRCCDYPTSSLIIIIMPDTAGTVSSVMKLWMSFTQRERKPLKAISMTECSSKDLQSFNLFWMSRSSKSNCLHLLYAVILNTFLHNCRKFHGIWTQCVIQNCEIRRLTSWKGWRFELECKDVKKKKKAL